MAMTPREAGIQAFYADESTSNTLQGLNAAFDAYEAAARRRDADILKALKELCEVSGRSRDISAARQKAQDAILQAEA